ncbi:MAG: HEPN domain-containing protein [Anaerolineales bacterium]|nr:HEPN domain-containing protein [Anaerolineales bacterium]
MVDSRETRQQELARLLLQKARQDLAVVVSVADSEAVADEIVGFHIQQAIEKAIKSALTRLGRQYEFTHDLSILYRQAENNGLSLPASIDAVEELTVFAVQFRYLLYQEEQGFDRSAGLTLAENFVQWADAIIELPTQSSPENNVDNQAAG